MGSALDALLDNTVADFKANTGVMAQVNPPQAATVLATQTAPEVAGKAEPPKVETAPAAATERPAEADAAKTRRTAAVVQVELDAANAELVKVRAELAAAKAAHATAEAQYEDANRLAHEQIKEAQALQGELERAADIIKELKASGGGAAGEVNYASLDLGLVIQELKGRGITGTLAF